MPLLPQASLPPRPCHCGPLCPCHCGLAPQSLGNPNEKRLRVKPAMTERGGRQAAVAGVGWFAPYGGRLPPLREDF